MSSERCRVFFWIKSWVRPVSLPYPAWEQLKCPPTEEWIKKIWPMDMMGYLLSLTRVRLFVTPWTAAHQASLSITNSRSLLKLMSIELVMPSNHLILCLSLLCLPSVFARIRVFFNESALHIRYYSAIKTNEIVPFAEMCMDLETVIQGEVSQKEKNKYCILMHVRGI